jgi:hypothetical protein
MVSIWLILLTSSVARLLALHFTTLQEARSMRTEPANVLAPFTPLAGGRRRLGAAGPNRARRRNAAERRGIGPALEARDVLNVLRNTPSSPEDLRGRAVRRAGTVLERAGAAPSSQGKTLARANSVMRALSS